jgi:hypothetical protein
VKRQIACILFYVLGIFSTNAQSVSDTTQEVKNNSKIMFDVGYSFVTGLIGKTGIIYRITDNLYAEAGYSYYNHTFQNGNLIDFDIRKKYLIGINYLPENESNFFYNFSFVFRHAETRVEKRDFFLPSINIGTTNLFSKKKHSGFGVMYKAGVFFVLQKNNKGNYDFSGYYPIPSIVLPNLELSFFYGFK